MIVDALTVTNVMLSKPLPSAVEALVTPEMKIEPAPEVSKVIVDVVEVFAELKLKALVAPRASSTAMVIPGVPVRVVVKEAWK